MNAGVNELLARLSGNEFAGFILVLARVTPLFFLAPLFSSQMLPPRVRAIVAVGISIGLSPIAMSGQHIPGDPLAIGGLLVEGLLVGLGFAFAIAVLFAAVESAGGLIDVISGFSYGGLVDPLNGNTNGVMQRFYGLFGALIFLAIGGEEWLLEGLAKSFELVPLTSAPKIASLVGGAEHTFASVFVGALEVGAPVLVALLITDVAFGVVSRVVPQLNVFAVGFPAKVAAALLVVGASLPFVSNWLSGELTNSVRAALQTLHVA